MSAGKQPVYLTKIRGASGLSKALAIGGGTPDSPGPLIKHCNSLTSTGATQLTAETCYGVLEMDPGGAVALKVPSVTEIAAAFPEFEINTAIDLYVVNKADAAETITMTQDDDTEFTVVGLATIGQNVSAHFKLLRTGAAAGKVLRVSQ